MRQPFGAFILIFLMFKNQKGFKITATKYCPLLPDVFYPFQQNWKKALFRVY